LSTTLERARRNVRVGDDPLGGVGCTHWSELLPTRYVHVVFTLPHTTEGARSTGAGASVGTVDRTADHYRGSAIGKMHHDSERLKDPRPAHNHDRLRHPKPRCQRASERPTKQPDIEWKYLPRIPPGNYSAISRGASRYFDGQFKRWVCAVQFDIVSESASMEAIARLTWFLNLGSRAKPKAGRRTKYWAAWVRANGGPPKRGDRLSLNVFTGRRALVRVEDTAKTHDGGQLESEQTYSVVRDVIEWQTGGGTR